MRRRFSRRGENKTRGGQEKPCRSRASEQSSTASSRVVVVVLSCREERTEVSMINAVSLPLLPLLSLVRLTLFVSMSAVLPPKRPPRTPLKLQLPGSASPSPQPSSDPPSTARPQLSLPTVPSASSRRPSLKLASLSSGMGGLSLAIPSQGISRYSSALNGPDESDSELDDGGEDSSNRPWGHGEQERMAGELLDVINGTPVGLELEEELSGATRRPRSASRVASRRPSFNKEAVQQQQMMNGLLAPPGGGGGTQTPNVSMYGEHVQHVLGGSPALKAPGESSRFLSAPGGAGGGYSSGYESSGIEDEEDEDALDISPAAIEDLGRLGEGASGEVRKVRHKTTGLVMAQKVRSSLLLLSYSKKRADLLETDYHDLAKPEASQAASSRAPLHARLHS